MIGALTKKHPEWRNLPRRRTTVTLQVAPVGNGHGREGTHLTYGVSLPRWAVAEIHAEPGDKLRVQVDRGQLVLISTRASARGESESKLPDSRRRLEVP